MAVTLYTVENFQGEGTESPFWDDTPIVRALTVQSPKPLIPLRSGPPTLSGWGLCDLG